MGFELQSYDRFSEHRSFIWQSLKELHLPVMRSGVPPRDFVASIVEILFPHMDCSVPGRSSRTPSASGEYFSRFPCSSRAFWVHVGLKWTPNDKVMTVLVNTGPLYGSPWKNFIFSWRATPKFCVLLLLAVTHVNYGMPHGENKENKAYSRCIFLNLQPNEMPRII